MYIAAILAAILKKNKFMRTFVRSSAYYGEKIASMYVKWLLILANFCMVAILAAIWGKKLTRTLPGPSPCSTAPGTEKTMSKPVAV